MIYRFKNVDLTEDDWSDLYETVSILQRKGFGYPAEVLRNLLEKADRIPGPVPKPTAPEEDDYWDNCDRNTPRGG